MSKVKLHPSKSNPFNKLFSPAAHFDDDGDGYTHQEIVERTSGPANKQTVKIGKAHRRYFDKVFEKQAPQRSELIVHLKTRLSTPK